MGSAPFQVGGIVKPPYFIGRDKELKEIILGAKTLSQNYLILAARRMGKSSLMANVGMKLKKEKNLLVSEINCLEAVNGLEFSKLMVQSILKVYEERYRFLGLLELFKRSFRESTLQIIKSVEKIGGTFKKVIEVYISFREKQIDEHELIKKTFEFLNDFSKEKKLKIIIIFDEFQKLAEFDGFIFSLLKSNIDKNPNIRYIFSGSSISLLRDVLFKPNSPLYLMTTKIYLKPIEKRKVKEFFSSRLKLFNLRCKEEALEKVFNLTGGIPFYFQKLGDLCYKEALEKEIKEIDEKIVEQAFEKMLKEFSSEFEERLGFSFSPRQQAMLKVMANVHRASEIAKALNLKVNEISKDLRLLVESMTIEKLNRGEYKFVDVVLESWLSRKKSL